MEEVDKKLLSDLIGFYSLYLEEGISDEIKSKDASIVYGERTNQIYEVIGCNHIFLFIHTKLREELSNFLKENCEFTKIKKMIFSKKLGEQAQDKILDNLILFYTRYVSTKGEITKEVLEVAEWLNTYDHPHIFPNIPSEIVQEALSYASNVYLNTIFEGRKATIYQKSKNFYLMN